MDCRDAQFYLRMRRHSADELGTDVTTPLDEHLAGCLACAADARTIGSFDRAVASAMLRVPVPAGLRDKLVAHVASKRGEILRRKLFQTGGAVVAALLVLGITAGLLSHARPHLNVLELTERNGEQYANPQESTEKWLTKQKLPDKLPLPFDYDLLVHCGHETVQGREVPVVVFRSRQGSGFAKVYILPHDGPLNAQSVQEANTSHARAEILVKQETRGNVTYVLVHTGGPNGLGQFLRTGGSAAG